MMDIALTPTPPAAGARSRAPLQPRDANANSGRQPGNVSKPSSLMPSHVPPSQQLRGNNFSESLAKLREAETKRTTSYSGWLTKKPVMHKYRRRRAVGGSKSRFFRMTNEALYYYRDDTCAVLRGRVAFTDSTRVRLVHTMPQRCFQLEDDSVLCCFEAASEAACDDWVCQLQQAVEAFQAQLRQRQDEETAVGTQPGPAKALMQQQRHEPRRLRDSVLGRRSSSSSIADLSQQQPAPQHQERLCSSSISIIADRPSTGDAGTPASPDTSNNVPTLRQAMSTCKKRASTSTQRVAAMERENEELRAALAAHQMATAAHTPAVTDGSGVSTETLQAQLRALQAQLQAKQQEQEGQPHHSMTAAEPAATGPSSNARASACSSKADQALMRRRMNIEAHHETCNCNIM